MPVEPFLAQITIYSFGFAPQGWAQCNGQLMQINQNQALFSLLGTTYGGNGQTTFALPDLRGRVPFHRDNPDFTLGQSAGEQSHTLALAEMTAHTHVAQGTSTAGVNTSPAATEVWAPTGAQTYAASPTVLMKALSISNAGGGQAHENMSPYLTLNLCIALQGIFPSQN